LLQLYVIKLTCAAAFDTEYIIVPFSPTCGTLLPAVELTMMILEGSRRVPAASNIGANLGPCQKC
jgi:hypothetical protein